MREELRVRKRERYLRAARVILVRDGLEALTMQAIASEVGAAVGTIYGYFPSKQMLVAELQLEAIATMLDAWAEARALWLGDLAEAGVVQDLEVAEYLAFGEFFLRAQVDFEFEFDLNQLQLDASREIFHAVDVGGAGETEQRFLARAGRRGRRCDAKWGPRRPRRSTSWRRSPRCCCRSTGSRSCRRRGRARTVSPCRG